MKLWIDDLRPAPDGYVWAKSVNEAKDKILMREMVCSTVLVNAKIIEIVDIDHDAGDFACDGGDYIKLLDWLEETGRNYPIRIHTQNSVGRENMRRIIQKNGWKEVR